MKIVLALIVAGAAAEFSQELAEWSLREHFALFEAKYEKAYASGEERESRFLTFVENLEQVIAKNAALRANGEDEVHGVTKFSDMSKADFARTYLTFRPSDVNTTDIPVAVPTKVATEKTFDWRDSNMVTPVKNQAQCGSCWAHSAVETLESQYAINGGDLTAFSVQQVVSCDNGNGDMGCEGGWYYTAWMDYIAKNGGLTTEANYPYDTATSVGRASDCDSTKEKAVTSGTTPTKDALATPGCTGFFCNSQDEDTLKNNLVSYGPISVACDASEWSSYSGGVMTSSSCSSSGRKLDHAIQVVGYNEDASTPYWIVRNSWDTTWGEDGYIYLKMGDNTCGIADAAWMVTL
jgi:C1A family cysteine protease